MNMSESIGKLTEALAKAQSEMGFAKKDKDNAFFKSSYADLASCIEVSREPLSKNGLAVIQTIAEHEQGVKVETLLTHISGEWIRGEAVMPMLKRDPQAMGSAITYGRRYSLCAIINLASDDDDGESAMNRGGKTPPKAGTNDELAVLRKHVDNVKDESSANAVYRMIGKASTDAVKGEVWNVLVRKASGMGLTFDRDKKSFIKEQPAETTNTNV